METAAVSGRLRRAAQRAQDPAGNIVGGQPEAATRVLLRADLVHELVRCAEGKHARKRTILRCAPLCDGATEAAEEAVLLYHCYQLGRPEHFGQPPGVQRLDGVKALD